MPPAANGFDPHPDHRDREIIDLRARLAEVGEQLVQARLATEAVEQQLQTATARAAEVEHHLHRRIIEVTDLKNQLAELTSDDGPTPRTGPMARRFSPLLARTTLRLHRSDGSPDGTGLPR